MITGHQTHRHKVEIRVVHLGHAPCRLEVRERMVLNDQAFGSIQIGVSTALMREELLKAEGQIAVIAELLLDGSRL